MPVRVSNGNRCGHDLRAPRFFQPPPTHAARPPIIVTHIARLNAFYDTPDCIPSLAYAQAGRRPPEALALIHPPRRMRSERREACCALLGAIAHYCDLPSMTLSVPQPDGKTRLPVRLETLAEAAGLGRRRAERAMRDIQSAGLLRTFRRAERRRDGSYRGRAAIRVVPTAVFGLFGQEQRLAYERKRISQARLKARETQEPTPTQDARGRVTLGGLIAPRRFTSTSPSLQPAAALIRPPPAPTAPPSRPAIELPEPELPPRLPGESVAQHHLRAARQRLGRPPPRQSLRSRPSTTQDSS